MEGVRVRGKRRFLGDGTERREAGEGKRRFEEGTVVDLLVEGTPWRIDILSDHIRIYADGELIDTCGSMKDLHRKYPEIFAVLREQALTEG